MHTVKLSYNPSEIQKISKIRLIENYKSLTGKSNKAAQAYSEKSSKKSPYEISQIAYNNYGIADIKLNNKRYKAVFDSNKKLKSYINIDNGVIYEQEFERDKKGRIIHSVSKINGEIESFSDYFYNEKDCNKYRTMIVKNRDRVPTYIEVQNKDMKVVYRDFCGTTNLAGYTKEELEYNNKLLSKRTLYDINNKKITYEYDYDNNKKIVHVRCTYEPDVIEISGYGSTKTYEDGMIRDIYYKDRIRYDVCKDLQGNIISKEYYNKYDTLIKQEFLKPDYKNRIKIEYDDNYSTMTETYADGTINIIKLGL